MKTLVLATAELATVVRSVARLRHRLPSAPVLVAVTEVEKARFERAGLCTLVIGEQSLQLDALSVRQAIGEQGCELLVVPIGLPRQPLLFVARLVRSIAQDRFVVDAPLVRHLRQWRLVWLVLVAYSLLFALPVVLAVRCGLLLDGALLLAAGVLARVAPRRQDPSHSEELICHTIPNLGTGGAQRQLVEYLRRSVKQSRCHLLVLHEHNEFLVEELRSLNVPCELLGRPGRQSWLRATLATAFPMTTALWALWRRLRALRPSAVYSWLHGANIVTAPAARLAGVPRIITSVRNLSEWKTWPEYRRWWRRPADRLSAPLSTVIVANSRAVAADYATWAALGTQRLQVVPNGIDMAGLPARPSADLPSHCRAAEGVPIVLTMGRLASEKNQAMLLRACARVRDGGLDLRLLVVGHGELEPELQRLCAALGLENQVVFINKTGQPQSFYRAADLFVLSSRIEGMPNVVIEAQACALPVVTTDCGGSAEVVADGETGLVVGVDDEQGLAAAMSYLLADPQLRRAMGRRGQHRMSTHFDIGRMAAAIDDLCTG